MSLQVNLRPSQNSVKEVVGQVHQKKDEKYSISKR